ncbi:hypothetical protein L1887_32861 [Cichorium endivia]|nr:hypothetical protein L1887_32861 [Cichorium endivia]
MGRFFFRRRFGKKGFGVEFGATNKMRNSGLYWIVVVYTISLPSDVVVNVEDTTFHLHKHEANVTSDTIIVQKNSEQEENEEIREEKTTTTMAEEELYYL